MQDKITEHTSNGFVQLKFVQNLKKITKYSKNSTPLLDSVTRMTIIIHSSSEIETGR